MRDQRLAMNMATPDYPGKIIGLTRRGEPIRLVGGGDGTTTLQERRTDLLRRLEDDTLTAEQHDALMTEVAEVTRAVEQHNARESARRALGGSTLTVTEEQRGSTGVTPPAGAGGDGSHQPVLVRTAGEMFTSSESLTQFRARGGTGTASVTLADGFRAVIDNSATSAGAFQNPARPTDVPQQNADRPLRLVDLIDRRTTDSNTVEYVQETNAAGGGSAAETAEGAVKPESTYTFVVVTEPVRTIAHWVNITRQALDDNGQMRGYIDGRLSYGLDYRLDQQVLSGNGTSPNLRGILNTTGLGAYTAAAGEAAVVSVRRAMTVAQTSEYEPDTVVLNPVDWERIELSQDSNGMFRVTPNVAGALAPRIWGLTVVPTMTITGTVGGTTPVGGRFLVGAMRQGVTLWERQGVTVFLTDSHASNFTSNILTLLAERRAALSVWRPSAIVGGTFSTGTA